MNHWTIMSLNHWTIKPLNYVEPLKHWTSRQYWTTYHLWIKIFFKKIIVYDFKFVAFFNKLTNFTDSETWVHAPEKLNEFPLFFEPLQKNSHSSISWRIYFLIQSSFKQKKWSKFLPSHFQASSWLSSLLPFSHLPYDFSPLILLFFIL